MHVLTRVGRAGQLALGLGAASAGDTFDRRPSRSTRPSCSRRPATWCRRRSAHSTAAAPWPSPGIHLSDIPPLDYQRQLFQERPVRSVTANTRLDGEEFLRLAASCGCGSR